MTLICVTFCEDLLPEQWILYLSRWDRGVGVEDQVTEGSASSLNGRACNNSIARAGYQDMIDVKSPEEVVECHYIFCLF